MGNKLIYGGTSAIAGVLEGMDQVATVVGSTYGPNGRNVIIEGDDESPHITKDGVTVAKSISFSRPDWSVGASLIQDAAIRTLKEVGDGTTTTTILANIAAREGIKRVQAHGLNPFQFRTFLERYLDQITKYLQILSEPIEPHDKDTLMRIALNSANGDKVIAEKVTSLFGEIGKDGVVFVKDSDILGIHTQVIKGISINRGYISPQFCNGQSTITLEDCKILISKKVIRDYKDIIPYLQNASDENRPILLIVPEVDNTIMDLFLTNVLEGRIRGCVIQAPFSNERQDDFFQDLGIASGAIKEDKDFNSAYLLGEAEKVIVGRYDTEFQGLVPDEILFKKHLAFLEDLVQTQTDRFLAEKAGERMAMFVGNIGYIHVGASSEAETLELKDKLDDVIHAVKAALKEGAVPGGGRALALAETTLSTPGVKEEFEAREVMRKLCLAPISLLGKVNSETKDPTKVVYTALKNAISVAGLLFTSNYVILDERQYQYENCSKYPRD